MAQSRRDVLIGGVLAAGAAVVGAPARAEGNFHTGNHDTSFLERVAILQWDEHLPLLREDGLTRRIHIRSGENPWPIRFRNPGKRVQSIAQRGGPFINVVPFEWDKDDERIRGEGRKVYPQTWEMETWKYRCLAKRMNEIMDAMEEATGDAGCPTWITARSNTGVQHAMCSLAEPVEVAKLNLGVSIDTLAKGIDIHVHKNPVTVDDLVSRHWREALIGTYP